ncbi:MAG: DEAD/DEAH box helicase [Bacteroidales bacterium]|nr:DEAD/DEAH box helicase [Bacteroidales bacterium]MBN2749971.1 DEAD/DEAH box helicase [Bacteroidales bacterium]
MNTLKTLQARIKGARLYVGEKKGVERLYIPYGKNGSGIKTSAWFEVVNDRLQVFCRVENNRHPNYYDDQLAAVYRAEIERQFHELINDCELERKKVPLDERLKDFVLPVYDNRSKKHQVDALRFLCSMKVSALWGDPGTMKSKTVIDLAISRYEAGQIKKVLVFLPVSTKKNFKNQLEQWCSRKEITWKLIGIESMSSSDRAVFEALDFADSETQIIIDESHLVKGPFAKRSKRIAAVCEKSSYKVVMTGTPADQVHNLYMQYAMLSKLIIGLPNYLKFEEKYLILGGVSGDEIIGHKNIDHLLGLLEPYTYQISSDILGLPAKEEIQLHCSLTQEQDRYYTEEKERLLELIQSDDFSETDIFAALTHMQQIASGYIKNYEGEVIPLCTNKFELLDNIDLTKPTVFFCKYIFEVQTLVSFLNQSNCATFTGKNPKTRDDELQKFVAGEKLYFVCTMQSGGTGLNGLQEVCCQGIFFSNSFMWIQRKQSTGRLDRPGQQHEMKFYDCLTRSGIDYKVMANLARKGNLASEIKELMKDKTKLKRYVEEL